MKIFRSREVAELARLTCEIQKINTLDLMERAASSVACEIISRFLPSKRIVVMAGVGFKGGVALAAARQLLEQGYKKIEILFFNIGGEVSHDCNEERNRLITIDGIDFTEVTTKFFPPYLDGNDVVIDGLYDSDAEGQMVGGFATVAQYINSNAPYVVSIDLPSGLMGEENLNLNTRDMVHANLTLVFQNPRMSFFYPENHDVVGEWKVIDLDLDPEKKKSIESPFRLMEARNVRPLIRPRNPFTAKRDYGSVMLFAGSTGMTGASVLAAQATLRSGAGIATVHGPKASIGIVQTAVPEVMFEPDRTDHFISDMTVHHRHQAVAVGPGIGTRTQTIDALEALLKSVPGPLVLDADALNCMAKRPSLIPMMPHSTIITPHVGEFDRLFGEHRTQEERLNTAVEVAKQYKIVIVLKGHYTFVIRPTGTICVNTTGNPGMATAGAGDVLTGVISAFLAQGYSPTQAAMIGVYIHGLAGDLAAEELGEYGVTASEISHRVGRAVRHLETED